MPFHIQQNTTPKALKVVLASCVDGAATTRQLASQLALAAGTVQHIVRFARQVGLIQPNGPGLTDTGTALQELGRQSPALFPEAMHQLLYTAHHFDSGKRFSWAYAQVVDALWASGERALDGEAKAQLVGMVVETAWQVFGIPVHTIAFSRKSVNGVVNWLQALDPPVLSNRTKGNTFRRRYFCSPASLLWAVDFGYRVSDTFHGVRVFLTPERTDQLCRLCVLDPTGLDNVLMMAKRMSDYERGGVFDYGTEGGFGRWLLLSRPYTVPAMPQGEQA